MLFVLGGGLPPETDLQRTLLLYLRGGWGAPLKVAPIINQEQNMVENP